MTYDIICEDAAGQLVAVVNRRMAEGWKATGGVCVTSSIDNAPVPVVIFHQALVIGHEEPVAEQQDIDASPYGHMGLHSLMYQLVVRLNEKIKDGQSCDLSRRQIIMAAKLLNVRLSTEAKWS